MIERFEAKQSYYVTYIFKNHIGCSTENRLKGLDMSALRVV